MSAQEIDIHLLEGRYASLRIRNDRAVDRLATSMTRHGQLTPVLAVTGQAGRYIVVDGYRRLAALKMLGKDTALVQVLRDDEDEALLSVMREGASRRWSAIEEAGIIQELCRRHGYSLREIARRLGRSPSVIKRRLDLLESLPDDILELVMSGALSAWAASRVMVPLARANSEAARILANHLARQPLSTRDLQRFYTHYQKVGAKIRQRMLADPYLFLKSLDAEDVPLSVEERWFREAASVCGILARMERCVPEVFSPQMEPGLRKKLLIRLGRARSMVIGMQQQISKQLRHDRSEQGTGDQGTRLPGTEPSRHRQAAAHLQKHGDKGSGERQLSHRETDIEIRDLAAAHQDTAA